MEAIRGRQPLLFGQGVAEPNRVPPRNTLDGQLVAERGARPLTRNLSIPRLSDRKRRELIRRNLDQPAAPRSPIRQRHRASLWSTGDTVTVEIRDSGRLANPLAGRLRPRLDATGGRGLWLIHQLCDLVEFGPGVIRRHLSLAG